MGSLGLVPGVVNLGSFGSKSLLDQLRSEGLGLENSSQPLGSPGSLGSEPAGLGFCRCQKCGEQVPQEQIWPMQGSPRLAGGSRH